MARLFLGLSPTFQGMAFMLAYVALQSCVWVVVRLLSGDMPLEHLVFYRNFFGFLTILPMVFRTRGGVFRTRRPGLHLLRGLVACVGVYSLFYAVSVVPLATVTAITYGAPLFTSLIAILWLGEPAGMGRIMAVGAGFIGMLVVVWPFGGEAAGGIAVLGLLAALMGTLMTAAAFICVKLLGRSEGPGGMVAHQFVVLLPVSFLLAVQDWAWPDLSSLWLLALMGLGFTLAQSAMARAFARADAVALMPLDFLRLVITAVAGMLMFSEALDLRVWAGALVIVIAVVLAAQSARKGVKSTPPAAPPA